MAIRIPVNSGLSMILSEMACKESTDPLVEDPGGFEVNFNFCGFECAYEELVFADLNDIGEELLNDKSSVLVVLKDTPSTFDITLIDQNNIEHPLDDDTYGVFFDKNTFSENKLKAGYLIEWHRVLSAIGPGRYTIKTSQIDFGRPPKERTSHVYNLVHYLPELADDTIRIESIQNGLIRNGIDYTGMEWYQSVRVKGSFGQKNRVTEIENFPNESYELQDNQQRIVFNYEAKLIGLPVNVADKTIDDIMLGNQLFITDYRLFSGFQYKKTDVKLKEVTESKNDEGNRRGIYTVKLDATDQATIKQTL